MTSQPFEHYIKIYTSAICMNLIHPFSRLGNHIYAKRLSFHQNTWLNSLRENQTEQAKWYHRISSLHTPIYPSLIICLPYIHPSLYVHSLQTQSSSPTEPTTAPSKLRATFLPAAPDLGAAVLLALGAGVVDDELEDSGAEELEGAAEIDVVRVVLGVGAGVVEVSIPSDVVEVTLVVTGVGVCKEEESVRIAVGTEAVEVKGSVATRTALAAVEDAFAPALEAAAEAVASAL